MRRTKINAYDETSPLLGGDDDAMSKEAQGVSQQEEGREQPKPRLPQHHITSLFTSVSGVIKQTIKNVTLEPMLFLKMLAEGNFKVVADTLEIDRVCLVNLNFTKEECAHMDTGNYTYVQINFVVQGTLCGLLILVLLLLQLDMNRQPTVTHAPAQPVTDTIYNVQDPESMTGEENACNPCVDTPHSHYM